MKKAPLFFFALLTMVSCSHMQHSTAQAGYKIARRLPLEGEGFWDYLIVDEPTQRLFVSHGTQVQVVDLVTGKQVGAIQNQNGVHGIAFAPEVNKGFITNGRDTSVTVFDLKTLAVLGKIKATGANPDAILYDPFSRHIFAFNHNGASATVIDPTTDKVLANIPLDGEAEFGVSDGRGRVYVNIEDKSEVAVINATTLKVEQNWPTAPGEEPTGLAYDAENQRLFSVCDEKMVVMDAKSGKVLQILPIGEGTDGGAYDPQTHRAFSSNGTGSVTVVDASGASCKVIQTLATQRGARTIALDHKTHRLYLPTADFEYKPGPNGRPVAKPGSFLLLEVTEEQ
ncbi:MAG: YncE family protein [Bacteroidetes bacterium]|nr:YncE family protein [Bacteroidota bacterium]